MQFCLNRPSRCPRYALRHAYTGCLHPRTHPADASAAWRPSFHTALEPQPHPGALAGAAAGPAGRAVETPYAAAAALSHAPGIGGGNPQAAALRGHGRNRNPPAMSGAQPNDPAAWGYAARSPMTGKIWRTTPALATRYVRRKAPFQHANCPTDSSRAALNLFHSVQTKNLPGTLHHSGNRPAPPSDHTPLARRSAFSAGAEAGPAREFGRARGVETHTAREFLPCPARGQGICQHMEPRNFAVPLPLLRRSAGDLHESQRRRIYADEVANPGVLAVAISDRGSGQVGKDRGTACAAGHAPRRVKDRSRAEAGSAPTDVLIGVRLIGVRAGTPVLSAPSHAANRR